MSHSAALNFADGKTFFIEVQDQELLLDAAMRQGITLPLDCREGVCATCQGRCDSGQYEQDYVDEDALTESDLAAGKILACQTRLKSNAAFYFDHASTFCQTGEALKLKAKVTSIDWVSDETVILKLDARENNTNIQFLAGQYARIYIPNSNEYRAYSFAHAPQADQQLQFLIRYLPHGLMGNFLKNQCQIGQTLELEVPFGSFYLRDNSQQQAHYFVAGGTGLSACLAMLDQMQATERPVYLYYAVRNESHLCEQERIQQYQQKFSNFVYQPIVSRPSSAWTGLTGYVQDHLVTQTLQSQKFEMYVCGPPTLVESLKSYLVKQSIEHGQFYSEKFLAAASEKNAA